MVTLLLVDQKYVSSMQMRALLFCLCSCSLRTGPVQADRKIFWGMAV